MPLTIICAISPGAITTVVPTTLATVVKEEDAGAMIWALSALPADPDVTAVIRMSDEMPLDDSVALAQEPADGGTKMPALPGVGDALSGGAMGAPGAEGEASTLPTLPGERVTLEAGAMGAAGAAGVTSTLPTLPGVRDGTV